VIEFTDRYGSGSRPPSWLRGCHGDCEATGWVPVNGKYTNPRLYEPAFKGLGGDPILLEVRPVIDRRYAPAWWAAHQTAQREDPAHTEACDGWHFVPCADCGGSGTVPRSTALSRVPAWLVKGVRFIFMAARHQGYRAPWMSAGAYLWLLVKCAYLYDLGWRD